MESPDFGRLKWVQMGQEECSDCLIFAEKSCRVHGQEIKLRIYGYKVREVGKETRAASPVYGNHVRHILSTVTRPAEISHQNKRYVLQILAEL